METMVGDDLYALIGRNIRSARHARTLSLEELAEKADLTPAFLGQVERCDRKLSVAALAKVARALKLTPNDLMGGVAEPSRLSLEARIASLLECHPADRKELILKMIKCLLRALRK